MWKGGGIVLDVVGEGLARDDVVAAVRSEGAFDGGEIALLHVLVEIAQTA